MILLEIPNTFEVMLETNAVLQTERMENNTHSYIAVYKKYQNYYTIYFPDFEVEGIGFNSFGDSKEFAKDLLAEILIEQERSAVGVTSQSLNMEEIIYDETTETVDINIDNYKAKFSSDENRSFGCKQDEVAKTVVAASDQSTHSVQKHDENQSTTGKRKNYIVVGVLIACLIVGISAMNGVKAGKWEKEIQEAIQESRKHISLQEYEEGYKVLSNLKENPETGDYSTEIESLYDYALLKDNRDEDGGSLSIEEQYQYSQDMAFDTDDELYKDATDLADEIKREYEEERQRIAEEEAKQATLDEAKEAKERRKYLEKLSAEIPFSGMEEEFIDCTACGAHTEETIGQRLSSGTFNLYRWIIDDEQVMEVFCTEGKVDFASIPVYNDGSISDYWTDDREPLFESKKKTKKYYPPGADYNENVDKYLTGKAYADEKYIDFKKDIESDYSSLSDEEINDIAWVNAFNAWLIMHTPKSEDPI